MISYAELEFAIARWKARKNGVPQPAEAAVSGAVEAEVPVATAPEGNTEGEAGFSVDTGSFSGDDGNN
jgi:hypothetical protein